MIKFTERPRMAEDRSADIANCRHHRNMLLNQLGDLGVRRAEPESWGSQAGQGRRMHPTVEIGQGRIRVYWPARTGEIVAVNQGAIADDPSLVNSARTGAGLVLQAQSSTMQVRPMSLNGSKPLQAMIAETIP